MNNPKYNQTGSEMIESMKYDHCMPECFKDIPWCLKLHHGTVERQEMSSVFQNDKKSSG